VSYRAKVQPLIRWFPRYTVIFKAKSSLLCSLIKLMFIHRRNVVVRDTIIVMQKECGLPLIARHGVVGQYEVLSAELHRCKSA
jgi:hypothetical protein